MNKQTKEKKNMVHKRTNGFCTSTVQFTRDKEAFCVVQKDLSPLLFRFAPSL